jgi:hypothetical protein
MADAQKQQAIIETRNPQNHAAQDEPCDSIAVRSTLEYHSGV